jgi:Family of unknown function (DUF5677)
MTSEFMQALQEDLTRATLDIVPLERAIGNERFFLYRLMWVNEAACGCVLLANAPNGPLGVPLAIVTRGLIEALISTYWASVNEDNLKYMMEFEDDEKLRIIKLNLERGHAEVVHGETGKIEADMFLNALNQLEKKVRKQVEQMANEAGLARIYNQLYRFLSMEAHGSSVKMTAKSQLERMPSVYERLSLVRGVVKCVHLIAVNRIQEKRETPKSDLENILGVKLSG